ncbi:hypothetical protein BHE74_00054469 [Ensete ventricosum]|nr:hypothetical protein BHE74_00054469 [Ensete ventricosum]
MIDVNPLTRPIEPPREKGPPTPQTSLLPQGKGPSRRGNCATPNQHYQAALFDRVLDADRVITSLDGKVTLLRQELQDLKEGGNPDAVAAAEVRAAEAQSLAEHLRVELDEANDRRASVEADLEKARSESASLERQLADLRERLGDSEGQLQSARAQVRQMETELLDLARSKEALREDLPKRAVEKYKELPGFEMGLMWMGRVSLEYRYQLALARLQARHPGVEIELDPFVTLLEDADSRWPTSSPSTIPATTRRMSWLLLIF